MSQLDMFGSLEAVTFGRPSIETVRDRLAQIMDRLQASQDTPLSDGEARSLAVIVPQIIGWLPESERDAVAADFSPHIDPLGRRAA